MIQAIQSSNIITAKEAAKISEDYFINTFRQEILQCIALRAMQGKRSCTFNNLSEEYKDKLIELGYEVHDDKGIYEVRW